MERGSVRVQGPEPESGQGERQDALGLAYPAAGPALRLARRRGPALRGAVGRTRPVLARVPLRQHLLDRRLLGHQTSRITGSTTGLRWNRWVMKTPAALPTIAPTSSRSNPSGSCRAARASRTAAFTSSISASASFMYTNPRR